MQKTLKLILHTVVLLSTVFYILTTGLLAQPLVAEASTVGSPSTMTYQGLLRNASGSVLSVPHDFIFKMFDAVSEGNELSTQTILNVSVTNGYFNVSLNFAGELADFSKNTFLQIEVRSNAGGGAYEPLTPRVAVTSVAYAQFARAIENSDAAPLTDLFAGRAYFNTTTGKLNVRNATGWEAQASTLQDAYNNSGTVLGGSGHITFELAGTGDFLIKDSNAGATFLSISDSGIIGVTGVAPLSSDIAVDIRSTLGKINLQTLNGAISLTSVSAAISINADEGISINATTADKTISIGTLPLNKNISFGGEGVDTFNFDINGASADTLNFATGGGTNAVNIGTGSGVDTIAIGTGGTGADLIRIGDSSADLALTDAQWSITTAGLITTANDIAVNGGNLTTTNATATLFNTGAGTSLSIGGAALTEFNIAGGNSDFTALNFGNGTGTHGINIGNGNTATGKTNTIGIGVGTPAGTGKAVITIGNSATTSTLALTGGNKWYVGSSGSALFNSLQITGPNTVDGAFLYVGGLAKFISLGVTSNATIDGTLGVTGATTLAALSATTGGFSSTLTLSGTGANQLAITGTPPASATSSLIQLGLPIASGHGNGTYIGANPAAFTGTFLHFQVGSADKLIVSSSGDLHTGGDVVVNGGDLLTGATNATIFNAVATSLSLGGAATTILNIGNGTGNYTAINLGSGAGTHTINIAGTGATAADIINIGTGGTGADIITIGSNVATSTTSILGATLDINKLGTSTTTIGNVTTATTLIGITGGSIVTIASDTLSLTDDHWSVLADGSAKFVSIGAVIRGSGAFTTLSANNTLTLSGTGANQLAITGAPAASATSSLIQLGLPITNGSGNGTYIGANPAAFTGNFLHFQVGGADKFIAYSDGSLHTEGDVLVKGGDLTTIATTATLFNTGATTLSLGGAATTILNIGNGADAYAAINLGSGAGTHTINIAGTGATAVDTINIGTGGTGADLISIGKEVAGSTTSILGATLDINKLGTSTTTIGNVTTATTLIGITGGSIVTIASDTLSLTDNNWSVTALGVAKFASIGAGSTEGTGAFTSLSSNGTFSHTGVFSFGTGTGNVSLNGNTTIASGSTLTVNGLTSINALAQGTTNIGGFTASETNIGIVSGAITTIGITGAQVEIIDNDWSIFNSGAAKFVSIGAVSQGSGAFTTLTSTGDTILGNNSSDTLTIYAETLSFSATDHHTIQIADQSTGLEGKILTIKGANGGVGEVDSEGGDAGAISILGGVGGVGDGISASGDGSVINITGGDGGAAIIAGANAGNGGNVVITGGAPGDPGDGIAGSYGRILIGSGFGTVSIDSNDWGISGVGDMSGIGSIAANGALTFSQTPITGFEGGNESAIIMMGTFSGLSSDGTYIAANAAPAFVGNFLDLQLNGVSKFQVASNGDTTIGETLTFSGNPNGFNIIGIKDVTTGDGYGLHIKGSSAGIDTDVDDSGFDAGFLAIVGGEGGVAINNGTSGSGSTIHIAGGNGGDKATNGGTTGNGGSLYIFSGDPGDNSGSTAILGLSGDINIDSGTGSTSIQSAGWGITSLGNMSGIGSIAADGILTLSAGNVSPSPTSSLIQLFSPIADGSPDGTFIGANPGDFNGDFLNFQVNGVSKFQVASNGLITTAGDLAVNGGDITSALSLNISSLDILNNNLQNLVLSAGNNPPNAGSNGNDIALQAEHEIDLVANGGIYLIGGDTIRLAMTVSPAEANLFDDSISGIIDIGGVDANGSNLVRIATNNEISDGIQIGNDHLDTTAMITGGNKWSITNAGVATFRLNTATAPNGPFAVCHDNNGPSNDILKDCNGAPTADYAERYPTADGSEFGDIMVPGSKEVITTNGDHIVQLVKSATPYQGPVVGIVSNNMGDFTSAGYNVPEEENPMSIALVGRVPVKVTDEGGPILVGDFITTSSTEGKGMKATKAGRVIGMALSNWDGVSPTVMVQVVNTWYQPPTELQGGSSVLLNEQGGITVADSTFTGNVTVQGHLIGSNDIAGRARMNVDKVTVRVTFKNVYTELPVVTFSSRSNDVSAQGAWISDEDTTGFTLNRADSSAQVEFNWIAIGVVDALVTISDTNSDETTVLVIDAYGTPAPAPSEPALDPVPEPTP